MSVIKMLYKLAGRLDNNGLYAEASIIDGLLIRVIAKHDSPIPVKELEDTAEKVDKDLDALSDPVELEELIFRAEMLLESGKSMDADDPLNVQIPTFQELKSRIDRKKEQQSGSLTPPLTPQKDLEYFERLRGKK